MNIKNFSIALAAAVAVAVSLLAFNIGPSAAEDRAGYSDIMRKLDEIIAEQKSMREELAAIKEELNIVKIRVTQNQ